MKRFNKTIRSLHRPTHWGAGLHEYFNGKTGRTGHLFDNRYSRVAVESDTQTVQLLDYIPLNPVKGAINSLEAYRWSSYKAYRLGLGPFDICDAAPMPENTHVSLSPMGAKKAPSTWRTPLVSSM